PEADELEVRMTEDGPERVAPDVPRAPLNHAVAHRAQPPASRNAPPGEQTTTTSDPTCWNGGVGIVGGRGSPGRRRPQFAHWTSVQADVPSIIALTQSTSFGTPP